MKDYKDMTNKEIKELIDKLHGELDERRQVKRREWLEKFNSVLDDFIELAGQDFITIEGDDYDDTEITFSELTEYFEKALGL